MKIMFLNLNYGRNDLAGILNFIEKDFDVLCFQEIKDEVKNKIDIKLFNYESSFISKEIEYLPAIFHLENLRKNN